MSLGTCPGKWLKLNNRPTEQVVKSPEDMRKETIRKADANAKSIFEKILVDAKKQLKDAEDPNNKQITGYAKGYPGMVQSNKENYQRALDKWEVEYPANYMLL